MFVNPYIGTIAVFAGNFTPRNWTSCNGQLLATAANPALFYLIKNIYGGDGVNTFALPDFCGRAGVHNGKNQTSGTEYSLGEKGGVESVVLSRSNLPTHNHSVSSVVAQQPSSKETTGVTSPVGNYPASGSSVYNPLPDTTTMGTFQVSQQTISVGGNKPVNIVNPYVAMNFIICTEGIYPQRGL